ncbi:MAG: HPr family phosphocarrier protein [Desulfobacterales bacterium]|nr:HPr family phosphocarrier protein [Desulfobacterales bacterium]
MENYTVNEPLTRHTFMDLVNANAYGCLKCMVYITSKPFNTSIFSQKLLSEIGCYAHLLEDFFDYHGAKNNRTWFYIRELIASLRHLSSAAYIQLHISNRIYFYDVPTTQHFKEKGQEVFLFLTETIYQLGCNVLTEAKRLHLNIPSGDDYISAMIPKADDCVILKHDIDDEHKLHQEQSIAKIASEYLRIVKNFERFGFYDPYTFEEINELVPDKVNEAEIRRFETIVHNLQSTFDSYVIHGGYRYGNRKFKHFRGFFSVVFHLFELIGRLLHLYERHLHEVGRTDYNKLVRESLVECISPEQLLDCTINYGLFYAYQFLTSGETLAKEILNENIERSTIKVTIPQKMGFHCRPSLLVAKIVQYFGGQVELCVGDSRFDASSVLDIQWAGGKIQQEHITEVIFTGDKRALNDIQILASVNYGEDMMGKGVPLPRELNYLMLDSR